MTTNALTVRWRDGHEVTGHLITDDPRRFLRALFCDPEVEFATATPIEGDSMSDIIERLRDLARNNGYRGIGEYWNACEEAADEIDRLREQWADAEARNVTLATVQRERDELRARVAELEAERDAAFKMSRCECDSDEACRNLVTLHKRVAELEAARGEPAAYLHQVVCGDGEPDQALSFAPDNFPLAGALGYRSLSYVPLYTAPRVDVNAIMEAVAVERERLCAAIKAADDNSSEGGYMLDSDDCISVIRGTWQPYDAIAKDGA